MLDQRHDLFERGASILHFAPEAPIRDHLRRLSKNYRSADIAPGRADCQENIESLSFADHSFDHIVCVHVLEHVDDARALSELRRVLKPGGSLIAMVPIVEGWERTYEDPSIVRPEDRTLHFGQWDHVRMYGRDFRDRVEQAGFLVDELSGGGDEVVRHGLLPGETVFVCRPV